VADDQSGEAVAAYIIRRDPELTAESVKAFARENLTAYKVPKLIHFRDALPKTPVGKVLRRMLRDEMVT
jgi:long-chain acyl-CoA synthetase